MLLAAVALGALAAALVLAFFHHRQTSPEKFHSTGAPLITAPGGSFGVDSDIPITPARVGYWPPDPLVTAEDVDPIVVGGGFGGAYPYRRVYAARTAMGERRALREFSSSGLPGDVGVDVRAGPTFDDGIPANWNLPGTPLRNYVAPLADYYDSWSRAPVPHAEGGYALTEPDHDPRI